MRLWLQVVIGVIVAALLAIHTLGWADLRVDTVSLGLIVILLLLPYIDRITRIRVGQVEAELTPGRAILRLEEVREEAAEERPLAGLTESWDVKPLTSEFVRDFIGRFDDPSKALAATRIDLERKLRAFAEAKGLEPRPRSLRRLVAALCRENILKGRFCSLLEELVTVLNAGAHGGLDDWYVAIEAHQLTQMVLVALIHPSAGWSEGE